MRRTLRQALRARVRKVYVRWIWRRCVRCQDEVKRECMWTWVEHGCYADSYRKHACLDCAPTFDDALRIFQARNR